MTEEADKEYFVEDATNIIRMIQRLLIEGNLSVLKDFFFNYDAICQSIRASTESKFVIDLSGFCTRKIRQYSLNELRFRMFSD